MTCDAAPLGKTVQRITSFLGRKPHNESGDAHPQSKAFGASLGKRYQGVRF